MYLLKMLEIQPIAFLIRARRACVLAVGCLGLTGIANAAPPIDPVFLETHCYDCHGDGIKKGGLAIDDLKTDFADAEVMRRWVQIHDRITAGEMPPKDKPQPEAKQKQAFLKSLAGTLTTAHQKQREVVLRRLNRTEYQNTLRDLFGVDVEVRDLLPEDPVAHGFDNIGAALASSTESIDAYLQAADMTLDAALGADKAPKPIKMRFPLIKDVENQIGKLFRKVDDGVAMFNSGYNPSAVRSFKPQVSGTYRVRIHARGFQSDKPVTMSVHAGDVIVHRRPYHLVGYWDLPTDKMTVIEFTERFDRYDTFHPKPYGTVSGAREKHEHPGPGIVIGDIEVEGPLEAWPPPSRKALIGDVDPAKGTAADIHLILERLMPRAFRRPIEPSATEPYLAIAQKAMGDGRSFMDALRLSLKAVLCSPEFLFLEEPDKADRISDHALAARLSYFLWSSMPDDALMALAAKNQLHPPAILRTQVERMLKDPKADAFVENFTGQWLDLREIDFTEPDKKLYPEYDEALKHAMLGETTGYFRRMLQENRSLLEFIDSDWTILNRRLAEHYGIDGITGTAFRTVTLPKDSVRGGILTQAAILKVTANGTNTSPVMRGVWVLERILGTPAPPPPAGVPAVEPDIRGTTTLREQLAKHRNVKSCAGCHSKIDPPGFALEGFDVIGGQRTWYRSLGEGERVNLFRDKHANVRVAYRKGPNVDATGALSSGEPFEDIRTFKRLLLRDPNRLAHGMTHQLMTYALGRGLGFSDRPDVDAIVKSIEPDRYRFRDLIHAIVASDAFTRP